MSGLVDVRELLGEFEEQPGAIRQVLGAILCELTRAQSGVAEARSDLGSAREGLAAYKEEVCELRSALDSERLSRASMEWRLDNLAEDFGDLVDGLKEAGVLVLGRDEAGEALVASAPALAVAQNFKKGEGVAK